MAGNFVSCLWRENESTLPATRMRPEFTVEVAYVSISLFPIPGARVSCFLRKPNIRETKEAPRPHWEPFSIVGRTTLTFLCYGFLLHYNCQGYIQLRIA